MNAERVEAILEKLNEGLVEREEVVSMTLLAVLSGQSVFLYGPPGTAKSMIASRISSVFEDVRYFEYLMQRFSTPEEVFGPISISELKNDNYVRKTEGFLPEADIAFLDEIWKSSPAILNTLLTIVNEHKFRNGTVMKQAPLKALIAASNEFPKENSGLEALYDRFIVRMLVSPIRTKKGFDRMICGDTKPTDKIVDPITYDEWYRVMTLSQNLGISKEALAIITDIRKGIEKFNKESEDHKIYVSDRRWVKSAALMRSAAYICGKNEVTPGECLLLMHCLWSDKDEIKVIRNIVVESVQSLYGEGVKRYVKWKEDFAGVESEISEFTKSTNLPPESFGFSNVQMAHFEGERTLKIEIDGKAIFLPVSRLRDNNGFTQAVKDMRTGEVKMSSFKIDLVEKDVYSLKIDNKEYLLSVTASGRSSILDRKRALTDMLESSEKELDKMCESMSSGELGSTFKPSPFLNSGDNDFLKTLHDGRSEEITSYRQRISDLRGRLDDYR